MRRVFTLFLFVFIISNTYSQSNLWNSFLVLDPSPTSFLSEWTRNPESSLLTVNYLGTAAVDFRLQLIIKDSQNRELVRARSSVESFPSGPTSNVYAGTKVIDWRDVNFDNTTYQQVLRTNRFPEGTFDVIIKVLGSNNQILTESSGMINIIYPDAPVLFAPSNASAFNQQFPIFQWAPVNLPTTINANYNLLIVERLQGQTLNQALSANPPHHQVNLTGTTFYQYPQDALTLEKGKEYAWRIRVTDDLGNPLTANNGSSELWSFIYDYGEQNPNLLPFLAVNLIRNTAWFDSYDLLQISQDTENFIMSGVTDLKLRLADGQQRIINVTVENLTFVKGSYTNFTFTAGRVYANIQPDIIPSSIVSEYLKPEYIEFTPFNGLSIRGRIELPGLSTPINPIGELTVSSTGAITGNLEFEGSSALPVYSFGNETAKLNLTRFTLSYPNASLRLNGELVVFNNYTLCEINGVSLSSNGDISGLISCNVPVDIFPFPSATDYISLKLRNVSGNFSYSPLSGASSIDLSINSEFGVNLPDFINYKVNLSAAIGNGMFSVQNFSSMNTGSSPNINLGFMKIDLSGLNFNNLSYQNGQWDFGIDFNMSYIFPDLGGFTLGPFDGLTLTSSGFNLPSFSGLNLGTGTGGGSRFFEFQGIKLEFFNGNSTGSSISLTDIVNNLIGGNLNLNFGAKISLPNLPVGTPIELINPDINLNANLSFNGLSITIPPVTFQGLEIPIAGGVKFNVKEFSGLIDAPFSSGGFSFNPELRLKGGLKLPEGAFGCEGAVPELELMSSYLLLSGNGNISGEVQNIVPACSLKVGNYGLNIVNSSLQFSAGNDGQKVILGGQARLNLSNIAGGELEADVAFVYDVLNNSLTEFTGDISTPYTLSYPLENPVLSFNLSSMNITKSGIKINGRSSANIGSGANIGVTFDELAFDYSNNEIQGGRIIFDNGFGINAALESGSPVLTFTEKNNTAPQSTGVMINMPDTLEITKDGLGIAGFGSAHLRYEGRTYDLAANFTNGFKIGLNNKEITAGKVDLLLNDVIVASLSQSGFTLYAINLLTTVLPAKLPLPRSDIAFIQLRDQNDSLLVNFEEAGENVRIRTKEGVPVLASFPGLKFNNPADPGFLIEFDITVDKTDFSLQLGRIEVAIPDEKLSLFDLTKAGIPYKLKRFEYKNENGITKLKFGGVLTLFETEIGNDNLVLQIDQSGYLAAQFDFNTNNKIFLIEDSDRLALELTNVAGSINTDLVNFSVPDFDIALTGGIRLKLTESKSYGASTTIRVTNSLFEILNFSVDLPDSLPKLAFGKINLDLLDFRLPRLSFSPEFGWDFDIDLDINLNFPELNFSIPNLSDIRISKLGLTLPELSIPNLNIPAFDIKGFSFLPLRFSMPNFTINIFDPFSISLDDLAFSTDFELKFPDLPKIPQQLKNITIYVVDAGFNGSRITGSIEDITYSGDNFFIPFGSNGAGYVIKGLGGSLSEGDDGEQIIDVKIKGNFVLPENLRCENSNGTTALGNNELRINSLGKISGSITGFVPDCDFKIGSATLNVTTSDLFFSNLEDTQYVKLDLAANLTVPIDENNTASGSGNISLDLISGRILDGAIGINEPFTISLPKNNPVFNFTINQASVSKEGLKFAGSSALSFDGGANIEVNFDDFLLSLEDLSYQGGSVSINSSFGLLVSIETGGLKWKAVRGDYELTQNNSMLLTMPSGITISNNKLALSGESAVSFVYNNQVYNALRLSFEDNCEISFVDFRVSNGRMSFYRGAERLAFIDTTGFVLDNILAAIDIPEKMPLGSLERAYLVLKNENGDVLIKTENTENGLRIGSREGQMIQLVVPALKYGDTEAPVFNISFDLTVNATTFEPVSGSILLEGANAPLIDLSSKGILLRLTRLGFAASGSNYELTTGGSITLPQSLGGLEVVVDPVIINNEGLSGTVTLGNYSQTYIQNSNYIKTFRMGSFAEFKLQGLSFNFGAEKSFKLSGDIASKFFKSGQDTTDLHFTALYQNGIFNFTFDFSHIPGAEIPIAIARFKPESIGEQPAISITFSQDDFELLLSGTLSAPTLSPEFEVSFAGLRISKNSVSVPEVDITLPSSIQSFKLFKAEFSLKNIDSYKAISFSYNNDVFYMSMSGEITFMDKTSQFYGFKVGTDGSISMSGANLLTQETYVVQDRIALSKLAVTSENNVYFFDVHGFVKLPQPADTGRQMFNLKVGTDGTISGGARVVILNEEPGLGGNDQTEFNLWVGKFDPEYIALNIDLDDYLNSNLEIVSSFYFRNSTEKYIRFGSRSGNTISPGLQVSFNGDYTWGPITANGLTDIEFGNLKLNITSHNIESLSNGNFKLTVSGAAAANFSKISGSLDFSNLKIHSNGTLENVNGMITGGSLDLQNIISLSVSEFAMSFDETQIMVTGGSNGAIDSTEITVKNFIKFGGTINIQNFGGGGIDEFLLYTKTDNSVSLTIKNANFSLKSGMVRFAVDISYRSEGENFFLLFAGRGKLNRAYDIAVIGKFERDGGTTRAGIFLAALNMPPVAIGPGIFLTGIGGGFFLNPRTEDINLVKANCGLDDETKGSISAPAGSFAVLVYGSFVFGTSDAINAKVLLTLSDQSFNLTGKAVLLNQTQSIYGTFNLTVGFTNAYAEGTLNVILNMKSLITADANLTFYIYDNNTWGIIGNTNFNIISVISGSGEFYVGNLGFYASASMSQGFNVWIVSVESGLELRVWYRPNIDWGAYLEVYINASVLGGIASARGSVKGVLIGSPNFYFYGGASLSITLLFVSWDGDIWLKVAPGGFSAGFGRDRSMDALIEEAKNIGDAFNTAAENARTQMANIPATLGITQETIFAAIDGMYQTITRARAFDPNVANSWRNWLDSMMIIEENNVTWNPNPSVSYFRQSMAWYLESLRAALLNVSNENLRQSIIQAIQTVNEEITNFNATFSNLSASLNSITSNIVLPGETPEINISNPLQSVSFISPQVSYSMQGENTIATVIAGPSFNLNESLVLNNLENINLYQAKTIEYDNLMKANLSGIEEMISNFDNLFSTNSEFLNFGNRFNNIRFSVESLYMMMGMFKYRERQYFINTSLPSLIFNPQVSTAFFYQDIELKNAFNIPMYFGELEITRRALNRWQRIKSLAGEDNSLGTFNSIFSGYTLDQKRESAYSVLKQLYNEIPREALFKVSNDAITKIVGLKNLAQQRLDAFYPNQVLYTKLLDSVFVKRQMMAQNLFEVLDRYVYWKAEQHDTVKNAVPSLTTLTAKRDAVVNDLTLPVISNLSQTNQNLRYINNQNIYWSTSSNNVIEYAIKFNEGISSPSDTGFMSIGLLNSIDVHHFPVSVEENTVVSKFQLRARNKAGFVSYRTLTSNIVTGPVGVFANSDPVSTSAPPDNTPPTTPVVTILNMLERGQGTNFHYVTALTNSITAKWLASDPQSGVTGYEYSIGTAPGSTNIRNWESVGTISNMQIQGLNLEGDNNYFVNVRAKNQDGLFSAVGSSARIFIDRKKPAQPVMTQQQPVTFNTSFSVPAQGRFGNIFQPLPAPEPVVVQGTVSIKFNWTIENDDDITHYEYRVITLPGDSVRTNGWDSTGKSNVVNFTFPVTSNFSSVKIELRSVRYTGVKSDVQTSTYYSLADNSKPGNPTLRYFFGVPQGASGNMPKSNLNLFFLKQAADPESGIDRYQFAITQDFPWNYQAIQWVEHPAFKNIPPNGIVRVPADLIQNLDYGYYYMHVRAVNNAGIAGDIVSSEQFLLVDDTPPVIEEFSIPGALVSVSGNNTVYTIGADQFSIKVRTSDPNSGITSVSLNAGYFSFGDYLFSSSGIDYTATLETGLQNSINYIYDAPLTLTLNTYNGSGIFGHSSKSIIINFDFSKPPTPSGLPAQIDASQSTQGATYGEAPQPLPEIINDDPSLINQINLNWLMTDTTGVIGYEYKLRTFDTNTDLTPGWVFTNGLSANISLTGSYSPDNLIGEIRSIKNTGSKSDILYMREFNINDNTKPSEPVVKWFFNNGSKLFFEKLSSDQESGVKYYQISIGASPGATGNLGWTVHDSFRNIPQDRIVAIPADILTLLDGKYLNIRAINGGNKAGNFISVGPVSAPFIPPVPVAKYYDYAAFRTLKFDTQEYTHSPAIAKYQYNIGRSSYTDTSLTGWVDLNIPPGFPENQEIPFNYDFNNLNIGTNYYVGVRSVSSQGTVSNVYEVKQIDREYFPFTFTLPEPQPIISLTHLGWAMRKYVLNLYSATYLPYDATWWYAIGSGEGNTDILQWTTGQGNIFLDTSTGLQMWPGRRFFIGTYAEFGNYGSPVIWREFTW
ncbi:MAG: hypothetical protein IAE91_04850 [Ignavibacteriaceae bacterium]|nr:hypothetical protein [Ignavibacteriaceae bacterium]